MQSVFVGLGSNVGDRQAHLQAALERLRATPGIEVTRVSGLHESKLVGDGPPQGKFLNGVAELHTTLAPRALLAVLQALEAAAGRVRPAVPNHPRTLDLDILLWGERRIDSRELVVPHVRWHEREFVCAPLRELGVDLVTCARSEGLVVLDTVDALTRRVGEWLAGDCLIGLVPTMGSLHAGHQSLMRIARQECDRVVATVFVNPLQFGPGEDFAAYPRDLDADLEVCREAAADVLFAPSAGQMVVPDFCSHVAVGREAEGMEGALRPGHFSGVATVVARLFAMARPHRAYFGQKDAQQLAVVRRMATDFGFPVRVVGCPIVREPDGLARSSRNIFLSPADRGASTVLYRALCSAAEQFGRGLRDRERLVARARAVLATEPRCTVDYVELRRDPDLLPLPPGDVTAGRLLIAARFEGGDRPVRLLDNLALHEPPSEASAEGVGGA